MHNHSPGVVTAPLAANEGTMAGVDIAALIISVLALCVAGASALFTRQQAVATRDQAVEAKRANDRVDNDRSAARKQADAEAERDRFRWTVTREPSGMYRLQNWGTDDAYDVVITINIGAFIDGGRAVNELPFHTISSQGAVLFALGAPLGNQEQRELSVRWRGHENPAMILSVPR